MAADAKGSETVSFAPKLFVFDVGGVFLKLEPEARKSALSSGGRVVSEAANEPVLAAANLAFRLGRSSEEDYVGRIANFYAVAPADVYRAETAFIGEIDPAMTALVETLKERYRVVCLSNTQAIHWQHILDNLLGEDFFDACYLSHEMGLEKPDPAIYRAVAENEGVRGEDIVFVDDTPENVAAALSCGWAHCIRHMAARKTIETIEAVLAG